MNFCNSLKSLIFCLNQRGEELHLGCCSGGHNRGCLKGCSECCGSRGFLLFGPVCLLGRGMLSGPALRLRCLGKVWCPGGRGMLGVEGCRFGPLLKIWVVERR